MGNISFSKFQWAFFIFVVGFACVNIIMSFALFFDGDIGCDFQFRYNEIKCCKAGTNPYAIWSETEPSEVYRSFQRDDGKGQTVHVYPPWEYTFVSPLTCFSKRTASRIYYALHLGGVLLIGTVAFRLGYRRHQSGVHGCFVAACAFATGRALRSALGTQNFGFLIAAAIVLMIMALHKRRDVLAGLCWAFIMVKPLLGLLFIIPLLIGRKYLTIAVAVATCLLASIPPAIWCDTSPIVLIHNVANSVDVHFATTGLFPSPLPQLFAPYLPFQCLVVTNMLIVVPLCLLLTWKLRKETWYIMMCPATACSVAWYLSRGHDFNVYAIVLMCVGLHFLHTPKRNEKILGACVIIVSMGSGLISLFRKLFDLLPSALPPQGLEFVAATMSKYDFVTQFGAIAFILMVIWLWRLPTNLTAGLFDFDKTHHRE